MTLKEYIIILRKTFKYSKETFISDIPIAKVRTKSKKVKVYLFVESTIYGFKVFTINYYHSEKLLSVNAWIKLFKEEGEIVLINKILKTMNIRKGTDYIMKQYYWSFFDAISILENNKSIQKHKTINKKKGK